MMSKGKFIIIEGIDGCGKGTQTKKLVSYFRKQKKEVKSLSYPDRNGPIGALIDQYLHKKYNFSKEVQFLLYFSAFLKSVSNCFSLPTITFKIAISKIILTITIN